MSKKTGVEGRLMPSDTIMMTARSPSLNPSKELSVPLLTHNLG